MARIKNGEKRWPDFKKAEARQALRRRVEKRVRIAAKKEIAKILVE